MMTAIEVVEDVNIWIAKLRSIHINAVTRYSQVERSVMLYIPLSLQKAVFPVEFLKDLETIGIVLIGAYNIIIDGLVPGTMGITGTVRSSDSALAPRTNFSVNAMQAIVYNWVYMSGPSSSRPSFMPSAVTIAKTSVWNMLPDEYRELFPEDMTIHAPKYRTLG